VILDAYAVLALLRGEPAADDVEALLGGDQPAALTSLGLAEVIDRLVRLSGVTVEEAVLDLSQLGLARPSLLDSDSALAAGELRSRHYHRKTRAVSMADCVAAAVAYEREVALATSDPHLLDLCHDEKIEVVPLPDSRGERWTPSP
jgi:PIN domain nuclease of toxin-antitoxin system